MPEIGAVGTERGLVRLDVQHAAAGQFHAAVVALRVVRDEEDRGVRGFDRLLKLARIHAVPDASRMLQLCARRSRAVIPSAARDLGVNWRHLTTRSLAALGMTVL